MVFDIMSLFRLSMLPYAILALRPGVSNFPDGGLGNGGSKEAAGYDSDCLWISINVAEVFSGRVYDL